MTAIFYSPTHQAHYPKTLLIRGVPSPHKEVPQRAILLLNAVKTAGLNVSLSEDFGTQPLLRVHTERYVDFLRNAFGLWELLDDASDEVVPNAFPIGTNVSYPESVVGRAGFHMADMACSINGGTWDAAYGAAQSAVNAVSALVSGQARHAYALCRPPGHHASSDRASGYCFLNNAAIAAQHLRDNGYERVSVIDVDVHHGNGTQEIFYERGDVQTVSVHCDPSRYYPFFWGYPEQTGTGVGLGASSNLIVDFGASDEDYLKVLRKAVTAVETFRPDALVVSLGLDTFRGDPYAALDLSSTCYRLIGQMIGRLCLPTVTVQEGGYVCPELGQNLVNYLEGFET
jgi:acetoin utilization deacetylase AcuC-like enzyme